MIPGPRRLPLPGLGDLGDAGKRGRIANRDVSQDLAIESDACQLQPVDQLAVGQAVLASSGVQADDPQRAHLALTLLTADIRVGHCMKQCLTRRPNELRLGAAPTFSRVQQPLVTLMRGDAALYSCHVCVSPLEVREHATNLLFAGLRHNCLARVAPGAARRLDVEVVATPRLDADDLAGPGRAEAL